MPTAVTTEEGRECRGCGKFLPWDKFGVKSRGCNGREPRCKACVTAYMKQYRQDHAVEIAEQKKTWALLYPESHEAARERYKQKYPKYYREAQIRWAKAHPETYRAIQARRRSRVKLATPLDAVPVVKADIVASYFGLCVYCGSRPTEPVLDHVVPLIHGGSNTVENVVSACRSCNARKASKSLLRFLVEGGMR